MRGSGTVRLRWPRSDRDDAHIQEAKSRSCKGPEELAVFGAGHRVRGDRRQGRSRLNSHVWLWCRWGRTSVDAFQHHDGERKLDASAQRRAPGGAGSRPRSPVSARSFACLSTHPRSSPAEPCGSLPVNWPHGLARPAHAGALPPGAAGGGAPGVPLRTARPQVRTEPGALPVAAPAAPGEPHLRPAPRSPRGELTVATRHPVASDAPIQPVFARAIE